MSWIDYPWGSVVLPMEALAGSSLDGGVESATRGAVSSSPVVDVVEGTSVSVLLEAWGALAIGSADHQTGGETVSRPEGFRLVVTPYA